MNNIIAKVRGARASRLNLSLHRHVNYECRSPLLLGQVPDTKNSTFPIIKKNKKIKIILFDVFYTNIILVQQ